MAFDASLRCSGWALPWAARAPMLACCTGPLCRVVWAVWAGVAPLRADCRLAARAGVRRVAVEAGHPGALVAFAAPRRPRAAAGRTAGAALQPRAGRASTAGRRARTCTRWTAARPSRPGPGPGSSPRSVPRRSGGVAPQTCCSRSRLFLLSQFLSHSPPSGAVRQCSLGWCLRSSRTMADASERRATLLESVLGATPQEFESPILRHR